MILKKIYSAVATDPHIKNEMIRFLMAGAFVGAIDFGSYYLLIHFLPISVSKGISFIGAGIVAYLINKHCAFRSSHPSSYPEIVRYTVINLTALAINVLMNQAILNVWPGYLIQAWIIASMSTGLFTFISFKWWVFKR